MWVRQVPGSSYLDAMLVLDDLLTQVALPLDTECATRLVEKLPMQCLAQCASGFHHLIESLASVQRPRQHHKQADSRNFLVLCVLQVETAGLYQACCAEDYLSLVVIMKLMEDTEFAVTHAHRPQIQYQVVTGKCPVLLRHETHCDDFLLR